MTIRLVSNHHHEPWPSGWDTRFGVTRKDALPELSSVTVLKRPRLIMKR